MRKAIERAIRTARAGTPRNKKKPSKRFPSAKD